MTRDEVLKKYRVINGYIQDEGMFEGEKLYVPHFWDRHQLGRDDGSEDGEHIHFNILQEEREEFLELPFHGPIVLRQDPTTNPVHEVKEQA